MFTPFLAHRFCHSIKLGKLCPRLLYRPQWDFSASGKEDFERSLQVLNAPLTFLDMGRQSYVFISEDGQYVVKIFRSSKSPFAFFQGLKSINSKSFFKSKKTFYLEGYLERLFDGVSFASSEGKQFSKVLYQHVNFTHNILPNAQLKIRGKKIALPMDQCRFIIQKKVLPFRDVMIATRNDPEAMKKYIVSLISLWKQRSSLGWENYDKKFFANYGFDGFEAVEIDVGRYQKTKISSSSNEEFQRYKKRLFKWFDRNLPERSADLRKCIEDCCL